MLRNRKREIEIEEVRVSLLSSTADDSDCKSFLAIPTVPFYQANDAAPGPPPPPHPKMRNEALQLQSRCDVMKHP